MRLAAHWPGRRALGTAKSRGAWPAKIEGLDGRFAEIVVHLLDSLAESGV